MRPVFVPNYLLKAFKVRSLVLNYRAYKIGNSYWQSHSLRCPSEAVIGQNQVCQFSAARDAIHRAILFVIFFSNLAIAQLE